MKIYAVGLGPGDADYLAPQARRALLDCDVVVGYTTYINLITELIDGKRVISTGMKAEVKRCETAIQEAMSGNRVCVVSSGDAGIYGMASLLFELAEGKADIEVEVIPGITAAVAAASVLGAPLTNDFAVVSLSDLLTPWEVIEKRLEAVFGADFVVCLYNPRSKQRSDYLTRACKLALKHKSAKTYCGYVTNALRGEAEDSASNICSLEELADAKVDMFTTVIIGNASTRIIDGRLVTARGYEI